MHAFRTLALCLTGLLALAGAAAAQDLTGSATAATDPATTALGLDASDGAASLDASAAGEHAAGALGADAQTGDVAGGDVWAWLGLHLDLLVAKLQEVFGAAGVAAPHLGGDAGLGVGMDGVDVSLATGDLTVEKSVRVPDLGDAAADASADVAGEGLGASAAGSLAGSLGVPALG